jgi:hypothetical protein
MCPCRDGSLSLRWKTHTIRSEKTRFVEDIAVRQEYDEARWRDSICDVDGRVELKVGGSQDVFGPSVDIGESLKTSTSFYKACVESSHSWRHHLTSSNVLRCGRRQRGSYAMVERR